MSKVIPMPEPPRPPGGAYSMGYMDGLKHGAALTEFRRFWWGVVAGVVLSAAVVAAVLFFQGAIR